MATRKISTFSKRSTRNLAREIQSSMTKVTKGEIRSCIVARKDINLPLITECERGYTEPTNYGPGEMVQNIGHCLTIAGYGNAHHPLW